ALDVTACPGPQVTGIDPPNVTDCIPGLLAGVTITGSGFVAGSTVALTMSGQPDIPGTNVNVQWSTLLMVDFDLTSGASGLWDVVVTNPIHIAVAIKYDQEKYSSPIVVAKGTGYVAERIRSIAEEHDIPLVEDKPLARILHKNVDVGQLIPASLYKAVAEILAYVYRLKGKSPV
ncbi:MAG: EscU/YscU/HrcU family type III secretion system export apparatus switch protein, partial [Proteobacteria bacterium]|nr:EscU/YscU/HrcU family type III secretion system export apparatus switch protein [Pseudomonadota bacterium]